MAADDRYERLGLGDLEIDDAIVGFCEMMSIKLGELMDQPRHVRVQALANEVARKAEAEKERAAKQAREKANAEAYAKAKAANSAVAVGLGWLWIALAKGEVGTGAGCLRKGAEADVRRFARKPELQLLVALTNGDKAMIKGLSPYQVRLPGRAEGCRGLTKADEG